MNKLNEIIAKLSELGEEIEFYGKNSIADINNVGSSLQVTFDSQFKEFLEEYGGGGIVDIISTNGILPDDPLSENIFTVYGATVYARNEFGLEKKYVVINSDFPEKCWVLDTSNSEENSIYSYNILNKKIGEKIYDNFNNYIYNEFYEYLKEIQ